MNKLRIRKWKKVKGKGSFKKLAIIEKFWEKYFRILKKPAIPSKYQVVYPIPKNKEWCFNLEKATAILREIHCPIIKG